MEASGLIAAIAAAFAVPVAGYFAQVFIIAFEARTHVTLSENQRQTLIDSSRTAAGEIVVKLTKGHAYLNEVRPDSALVKDAAIAAVQAAPEAADALDIKSTDMARLVTGQVGQMLAADPATPILAAANNPPAESVSTGPTVGFMDAAVVPPVPRIVPRS